MKLLLKSHKKDPQNGSFQRVKKVNGSILSCHSEDSSEESYSTDFVGIILLFRYSRQETAHFQILRLWAQDDN